MSLPRYYQDPPPFPDNDGRTKIGDGVFFHGTSRRAARRILEQGLRDWTPEEDAGHYRRLVKPNTGRLMHTGAYGRGTYVTCDWRAALWFGPVLFRVVLQPGTRVLRLDEGPDAAVLDSLRREFGKEILVKSPRKVMPSNKCLTLNEAIQLARYHANQPPCFQRNTPRDKRHVALMFELRSILVRYGIQAWGDPGDLDGIVVFATDRLQLREVVLAAPSQALRNKCGHLYDNPHFICTLEEFTQECRNATGAAARITHEWVEAANEKLRMKVEG